jgi:hypothetical protein
LKTPKQRFVEDGLGPTVVTIRPPNASSIAEIEEAGAGEQAADRAD